MRFDHEAKNKSQAVYTKIKEEQVNNRITVVDTQYLINIGMNKVT